MTIQEAIRAKLLAYAPLSALIGTRIYPLKFPQTPTYPAVTYFRLPGNYQSDIGVSTPVFQFDCWAVGYADAETLCQTLIRALEREKFIANGFEIIQCTITRSPLDLYDSVVNKYRVSVDFSIKYREA